MPTALHNNPQKIPSKNQNRMVFSFTIWAQLDAVTVTGLTATTPFNMVVYHSEIWRLTATNLMEPQVKYSEGKMKHIGGTFVERLGKGDRVAITQAGKYGFVYSGDGGGVLKFRGELIALSNFGA